MELDITNIAGIRSGAAEIRPGLNVVRAENWQGKSSFMKAVQVVMGTSGRDGDHPLTDGTSRGTVYLDTGTADYETELVRSGSTVHRQGDTYLTSEQDRLCAHLFAFLGEDNPVRAAVRNERDLASLLTRPLDLENIDQRLADLKRERRSVETELQRAEEAADDLPSVQQTVTQLDAKLEELRAEREELVADAETDADSTEQDELSSKRATREQLTNQISTLENKIARQEDRLEDRQADLADLTVPDEPELTTDIETKQDRIVELDQNISLLEDLHRVNKRVLDEQKAGLVTDVERSISGDELTCWVCGEQAAEPALAERLAAMGDRISDLRTERATLREEVEEIQARKQEIRQRKRRQRDLEEEIGELSASLEEHRSRLADLRERAETLTAEIETLAETVEETNDRLTDVESELKYKEAELERKREELSRLEREADRRSQLADERDDLREEIESLRTRRKQKKRELAAQFEAAMADVIDALNPGFEAARLDPKTDDDGRITDFELIVAREGSETSLAALSEGEVELLGIVTAVAGYETFDVADRVPVILLDGLTALSSANFHAVVEYLTGKADSLVTSAYPEIDEFDGSVITPEPWDVVSNEQAPVS